MISRIITLLAILLFISHDAVASRMSYVVFPMRNEITGDLNDWVGWGTAENIAQKLHRIEGFQVWDPVFLYQVDSTGCDLDVDSMIKMHRSRWQWDVALGGRYRVSGDTLLLKFKLVWATGKEEPLKGEFTLVGKVYDFPRLMNDGLLRILRIIQYKLSAEDSTAICQQLQCDFSAYKTYAQGYGFEMRGDANAALAAYARAEEIDPHCSSASCREGILYRRSNNFLQAHAAFQRAWAQTPADPLIVAEYANFLVECDLPASALKFVDARRAVLGKSALGMTAMGKMFVVAGEYQRAIALLTKAVAFGPADLDVEFALGTAYSTTGDFSRAADIFNHLIQFRPNYLRYYASLGGAYRKAGRLMESTIVLESAEKIAPDNTTILIDLAHTYIMLGWYEKAGQLLLRAREIAPLLSDINVNLGVVYWYQDEKNKAVQCFTDAMHGATTKQSALNNLGNVLFLGGSAKKAIEAYKKADEAGRRNETVLYNLAMAYQKEKNLKKASRYFDELLQLVPDRIDLLVLQASNAVKLKRYDDAIEYYHKIIDLMPDHEGAIRALMAILVKEKRYREALQPAENYLERQPIHLEFMSAVAAIYRKMEWYEVALMKYQALVRDFPDNPTGYCGVGECMYALIKVKGLQDYDNAILALKQASDHDPGNPEPDMLIGDIYSEYKGYQDLAVDHWKKALARASDSRMRIMLERKIAEKR